MKVSVSSYSFSQYINSGKLTLVECVSKAKELGFDAIEFTDIPGETYEAKKALATSIRAKADECGMVINSYTIGACLFTPDENGNADKAASEAEVERLKMQVDLAKLLGAEIMRHDVCYSLGSKGASRSFDLMLPEIARNTRQVTEYARTLGIRTCSENHGYIAQDSDRVERLFNAVNHDNYGLLVDVGNFICADENPETAVSRVAPYAIHVHAKDMIVRSTPTESCCSMTRGCNYFCGCVVGEGDIPVKKCLSILKRAGYDGYVSIEFEGREDCISGITRGLANLRRFLAEI